MSYSVSRSGFTKLTAGALAAVATGALSRPVEALTSQPDAQMQAVLDALAALHPLPLAKVTPDVARNLPSFADAVQGVLAKDGKPCVEQVGDVRHRIIAGPDGGQLLLRIYSPVNATAALPVCVYYHGGGWVIANLDTYDASCRALTNLTNAIFVSVAYRQAPEHKFPAAAQDAFAAYRWILANAAAIGGDPARVAVVGESAGGNLAAVTSLMARDNGVKLPVHQALVYPIANYAFDTPSYVQNAMAKPLDKAGMQWFFGYYLRTPLDGRNPYASPLRGNLRGLPPATIINADIDPLRDDGLELHDKLRAAGVAATRTVYRGVTHEFFGMGSIVDKAKTAENEVATALKSAFAR